MADGVQRLIEVHGPMSAVVFRLMVVLSILVQPTPSRAQKTVGYGETSCQSWTKERRTETAMSLAYSGWILGFVSGVNAIHILMVIRISLKPQLQREWWLGLMTTVLLIQATILILQLLL
jgi:hypothetical protein